ncbi:MAG: hypothetical protein ACYC2H_13850 [Thermoplasmatota archaeon]
MRRSTLLFWLAVILLFAIFGLAFLRFVAIAIGLFLLLFFGSLLIGAWLLRRRMDRKMAQLHAAFQQAQRDAEQRAAHTQRKRDAIDVDPMDVRDDRGGH